MKAYRALHTVSGLLSLFGVTVAVLGPAYGALMLILNNSLTGLIVAGVALIVGLLLFAVGQSFNVLVEILIELRELNAERDTGQRKAPPQFQRK